MNIKRLHITLHSEEGSSYYIEVRLPIRVALYIKDRFKKPTDGIRYMLYDTLGQERLIDKIDLLVGMELFKNRQQVIQFYLMMFYFKEINLHGSVDSDLFTIR